MIVACWWGFAREKPNRRYVSRVVPSSPIVDEVESNSSSVDEVVSEPFLFEDGELTADFSRKDPSECLSQFTAYEHVIKLHLNGFVFNEKDVTEFSNTFSELQELTLYGCGINEELITLLTLPSSLKSLRIERLHVPLKGIQGIIDKLSPSVESLEILDCLHKEFIQQEPSSNLSVQKKVQLDLSKLSHLKTICIENARNDFDSCNLLLSLTKIPLERMKLTGVYLSEKEWSLILREWREPSKVVFSKSLKEFNLKIYDYDRKQIVELIELLFLFPCLEIFLLNSYSTYGISLPPLPPKIKQFSLNLFSRVFIGDSKISFYNPENLSNLTHLASYESFDAFPYDLLDLNQLEYFKICGESKIPNLPKSDGCYRKLKYLSIQAAYLIPLLKDFNDRFPIIETLVICYADSKISDSHLETILSSKTLKYLEIIHFGIEGAYLNILGEVESSIEELKLEYVHWGFISNILSYNRFPFLKKIHITLKDTNITLEDIFKKLCHFPQLTSLTLNGRIYFNNRKLPFRFRHLKYFCLYLSQSVFDLDNLLRCMPNLIELQLIGYSLLELRLKNSILIRYLTLSVKFLRKYDFINLIKNTPNLIQLIAKAYWDFPDEIVPLTTELMYYFKKLREHFNDELQFKSNPNCFPIKLLKNDDELLSLVRTKSPELPNYFIKNLPVDTFKPFVKQLFTIDYEKYFANESVDIELVKKFFNFLGKLQIHSEEDIWLLHKLLFEKKDGLFLKSTIFFPDNLCEVYLNYLVKNIGINLESDHRNFIVEFYNANKNCSLLKIFNFFESFFKYLSIVDNKSIIINVELFNFFSGHLLTPSFCSFFGRIKEGKRKNEFIPFKIETMAEQFKGLDKEQYEELSNQFRYIFLKLCKGSFAEGLFGVLNAILISKPDCAICFEPLFSKECRFFKSTDGNCHMFHSNCLNSFIKESTNKDCPNCRRTPF